MAFDIVLIHQVDAERIVQLGQLLTEPVQHETGEVVGLVEDAGGEKGDVPSASGRTGQSRGGLRTVRGRHIGELLVPHLHSLPEDLLSGGVRQAVSVVDGLGYGIA